MAKKIRTAAEDGDHRVLSSQLSVSVPKKLAAQVDAEAKATGKARSAVIADALRAWPFQAQARSQGTPRATKKRPGKKRTPR